MFVIEGTADMGYNNSSCYLVKNLHIEETKLYQLSSLGLAGSPSRDLLWIYRTLHRGTDESSADSRPDEAEDPDLSGGASETRSDLLDTIRTKCGSTFRTPVVLNPACSDFVGDLSGRGDMCCITRYTSDSPEMQRSQRRKSLRRLIAMPN